MNLIKVLEFLKTLNHLPAKLAVDAFSEKIESGAEMADFSEHTGTEDAVQLMTIHKAKGLEKQVVYLADTTSSADNNKEAVFVDNSKGEIYYDLKISPIKKYF